MTSLNSREQYLKRYLDDPRKSKRKKRKTKSAGCHKQSRFKIVDEDIDMKKIEVSFKDSDESDDAPVIANVIDERPQDVKMDEMYSCKFWKKLDSSIKVKSEKSTESVEECNSSCNFPLVNDVMVKTRCDSEDDWSEPRSAIKFSSGDLQKSPRCKNLPIVLHDSESDMSPPRVKSIEASDTDLSPPRSKVNERCYEECDLSPPRHKVDYHHHYKKRDFSHSRSKADEWCPKQKDLSPSRSKVKDQHSKLRDFSPSRRKAGNWCHKQKDFLPSKVKTYDQYHIQRAISPPRKNRRKSKDSLGSSKKRSSQVQHSSDSDFSPPRKRTSNVGERSKFDNGSELKKIAVQHLGSCKTSHSSPPQMQHNKRTKNRHDSDSDSNSHSDEEQNSSKRKNVSYSYHADSQSPVPKAKSYRMGEENLHKPHTAVDSGVKKMHPICTLSGMKSGLQDSAGLQEEIRNFKRREKMALDELGDELSGRSAETVSRDKDTGRRRNLREERLKQKEKEEKNAEKLGKYLEWGKGLKQKDDQQKRLQEDVYEMSKPLARYVDDHDLETQLKDKLKEGDPMLEYIKKKRQKSHPAITCSLQVYEGPPAPPNRFNILPGYRWDGVDRSNGFEKRYFEKINNAKATEHQAYLWSIENM